MVEALNAERPLAEVAVRIAAVAAAVVVVVVVVAVVFDIYCCSRGVDSREKEKEVVERKLGFFR